MTMSNTVSRTVKCPIGLMMIMTLQNNHEDDFVDQTNIFCAAFSSKRGLFPFVHIDYRDIENHLFANVEIVSLTMFSQVNHILQLKIHLHSEYKFCFFKLNCVKKHRKSAKLP